MTEDLTPVRPEGSRASRFDAELDALRANTRFQDANGQSRPIFTNGVNLMGIFSRTRDIIAANFNDLLDKADDPAKMIRMIIMEMEETLVEVRASAARTIADQKEMQRHVGKLERLQADWAEKAQLALSKDREDLARAALVEQQAPLPLAMTKALLADGLDLLLEREGELQSQLFLSADHAEGKAAFLAKRTPAFTGQ